MITGLALLLGIAVLLPLLRFLLLPLLPALAPEFAPPAGPQPGLGAATLGSLLVSTASGVLAAPVAAVLGLLLERRRWAGRALCAGACWVALLLPGYLLVAGWEIVLDAPGWAEAPGGAPGRALRWLLLVGAMAARGLPLAVIAARIGWSLLPPGSEDAARVNLSGARQRLRPLRAAAAPILLLDFLLCFDQAMDEYGIAVVLGQQLHLPLLAAEVSASLSQWPVSWPRAATAADLLVATSLLPFLLRLRRDPAGASTEQAGPAPPRAVSAGGRVLAWLSFALLAGPGLLVPVLALLADLRDGSGLPLSPEGADGLLWSTLYGFVAASAAVALAAAVLGGTAANVARTWPVRVLPLVTLSVPGIVLGAAFVIGYGGAPVPMLGTPLALLLAEIATTLPVALLMLRAAMGPGLCRRGDAGRVHGIERLARIERLHWPALAPALAGTWGMCFCRLFFELPLPQMLAPAGREPVGVVLAGLGEAMRLRDEAVLACAGIGVCGAMVLLATGSAGCRR